MTSTSNEDDVAMMSSTQNKSKKANYSTLVKGNPPEGKTTAVVVIGHGIGGIDIPAKMARLAKSLSQE
jgi:hypothetical protein